VQEPAITKWGGTRNAFTGEEKGRTSGEVAMPEESAHGGWGQKKKYTQYVKKIRMRVNRTAEGK